MTFTFGAPGFLWALPLALLPLLVHIRARMREKAIEFPGAFFLQDPALPSAQRRRRIEDLLLLILRCLFLAMAISALARPHVKGLAWLGVSEPSEAGREAVVLVLDDSPSLSHRVTVQGERWYDEALGHAGRALAEGRRRRIAVETASGRSLPFADARELPGRLDALALRGSASSGDRIRALARARALLEQATEERRVVVMLTDARRNAGDSGADHAARWSETAKAFAAPRAPVLLWAHAEAPIERQWEVESLAPLLPAAAGLGRQAPVVAQNFVLRARVRCYTGAGSRKLRIETFGPAPEHFAAGLSLPAPTTVLEQHVVLDEGGSADVDIPAVALAPGAILYRARLLGPDELPFDDEASAVVRILPRRQVVLWDLRGEPGEPASPGDPARRALAAALDPLAGSDAGRVRLLQPPLLSVEDVPAGSIVVALHDLRRSGESLFARLAQGASERLRGKVQEGVHLLWVPDLSGRPESWPAPLGARMIAGDPLLPRAIERAEAAPGEAGWQMSLDDFTHPVLAPFEGGRNGDLGGVRMRRRLRLAAEPAADSAWQHEQVLARFRDGLPALIFKRQGEGSLGQLAFGLEPEGGIAGSAAWPVFLQGYLEWVADDGLGAEGGAWVAVGAPASWRVRAQLQPRRLHLAGPLTVAPAVSSSGREAGPSRWALHLAPRADRVTLPALDRPGLYRMRLEEPKVRSGPLPQRWFACRFAREESSPVAMDEAALQAMRGAAEASGGAAIRLPAPGRQSAEPTSADGALQEALEALRPGTSVTPWLWILFAAGMAIELGVLALRRRAG